MGCEDDEDGDRFERLDVTVEEPPDRVAIGRQEAQRTLDEQLRVLADIDAKAVKVLRVNVVLVGLVLTALSIAVRAGGSISVLVNEYVILGLVCLLASSAIAALTYTASKMRAGVDAEGLRHLLDGDGPDRKTVKGLVYSYANWIEFNHRINVRTAPLGTSAILLVVYALAFLSLGVLRAVLGPPGLSVIAVVTGWLLAITWLADLPNQLRQASRIIGLSDAVRYRLSNARKLILFWRSQDDS